ncbi:MAG: hypothetical protein QW507_00815 [Candidatus Nanoarchaeia archaeon]|nr:hypothetical protein [Candidatus Haiyanarchaeum thermophilum]MCW1303357.1 hypothetical protein [Candidatus Haiyanarchaeum thermophilum]MCW1303955.1 hypothetical protein [Candidatus Haiyanarchaeum thermophilum]MCW1306718.1 hypothetical protein [Candidatus Haiyanarchaeum thermophilum]MCW1307557.1 hypothetical protein [Candidatus Haiyanarchaeum thermophilum]
MEDNLNLISEKSRGIMQDIEVLRTLIQQEEAIKRDLRKSYQEYISGEISKKMYDELVNAYTQEISQLRSRIANLLYRIIDSSRKIYESAYSEIKKISESLE